MPSQFRAGSSVSDGPDRRRDLVVPATPEVEEIESGRGWLFGMAMIVPRQVSVVQDYQAEEEGTGCRGLPEC